MGDPTSGLTVLDQLGDAIPHLRVLQLAWDSPFRGTGLVPGDRIVAAAGKAYPADAEVKPGERETLIGNYQEAQGFAALGLKPGDPLTLTVRRRKLPQGWEEVGITGKVGEKQFWQAADNTPIMGPDGPSSYDNAGFYSGGWGGWTDTLQSELQKLLDPEQRFHVTSQAEAASLRETHAERVAMMAQKFPGPWASALKADWDAALAIADGAPVELPPNALDFRRRGEELAAQVGAAGTAGWEAAKAARAAEAIAAFPALNPARDDVAAVKGKTVVLPPLGNRDYVMDSGRTVFAAGSDTDGWYFIDAGGEATQAMLVAQRRYQKIVDPNIAARWEFLAQITGDARLAVVGERAHYGLVADPVAALVGGAMFVDLVARRGDQVAFAGEAGLIDDTPDLPPDTAPPAEVMAALVASIKAGDIALWRALHADWWIEDLGERGRRVHPHVNPPRDDRFEESLRSMKGRVIDARVGWVGEPVTIAAAGRYPGAEAIEEIEVWLDHVGDFGAGPRTFWDVTVTASWRLQRIGAGPWRVAEASSI